MVCSHISEFAPLIQPPSSSQDVYKDDCMYCFSTAFNKDGLNICLKCFQSFCYKEHDQLHFNKRGDSHGIFLNYQKIQRPQLETELEEKPLKMAKLEIKEKTEDELFYLKNSLFCIKCDQFFPIDANELASSLFLTIEAVIKATSSSKKDEIKSWEQEIVPCRHAFDIKQLKNENLNLHQCSFCDLKENLWLCLHCGSIGCGRQQFGGIPGNSHALNHYQTANHPIAVKLGSLSSDSADVYCYECNDEIKVPELAKYLKTYKINIDEVVKTEKNLTELQIDQNMKWDFNMDGENGEVLKPIFGEKLTGLKNLGNSCYMATVLQVLFSLKTFENAFYGKEFPNKNNPSKDLMTQLIKLANGLISGKYSVPDDSTTDTVKYQKGIKPSSFKTLIGDKHPEFSSMRQQDAFEFWTFLLQKIDQLYRTKKNYHEKPNSIFQFILENKLKCKNCNGIKKSNELTDCLSLPLRNHSITVDDQGVKKFDPTTFNEMFDDWFESEEVELNCTSCNSKKFTKNNFFKTYPNVLIINAQRIKLENWVPVKVDIPIKLPKNNTIDLSKYDSEQNFIENEVLLEDNEKQIDENNNTSQSRFEPNQEAMTQLQSMGFPEIRCIKALYNTGNNSAEDAMNWLFAHMDDADIDEPFVEPSSSNISTKISSNNKVKQEDIETLSSMGFHEKISKKALILNNNNVELAVAWLFENPADDGNLPDDEEEEEEEEVGQSVSQDQIIEQMIKESKANPSSKNYKLKAIICHKGTSIHSGHYVAFILKNINGENKWVLFNDEKVVLQDQANLKEMEQNGYVYVFVRDNSEEDVQ
ncbi:hypothetical protein PACTADRAFT_48487 [Pachysolen tannophilus NRRL Y-2460]|uniref:Ubiquitin carboxyl-terminal hydrolase n=1 Tax=Pachysolen tannophilus NRRL Y-2460 TaxID=669874 RepID=A0A1E4TY57_PACTA|nr:hypothetical protein PACTADRAFT_48487 [Pachysolen tannophilus NRRL Y-2460]